MPRTVRNPKIDSRSARVKLAARREPYWTVLSAGCALGYRKGAKGGTWIGRFRGEDGRQHYSQFELLFRAILASKVSGALELNNERI